MMRHDRFAAFILTHGRPGNVYTDRMLTRCGYTGRTYYVIDDEDPTIEEYRARFGPSNVLVFNKRATAETFDTADNTDVMVASVFARNAANTLARDLNLDHYIVLDDDYTAIGYRYITEGSIEFTMTRSLDAVFDAMIDFLTDSGAASVAMSQGGDHIGGVDNGQWKRGLLRKAMNSFVLSTDRPVTFPGRMNEDVNAYVVHGSRGDLFFTIMGLQLTQRATQSTPGGMSQTYLDSGTYVKSFYTVMMAPSCVQVRMMGTVARRFHHRIKWDHAVPKIMSGRYRKEAAPHGE